MAKTEQELLATPITFDSKDWQPYAGFGASDLLGQNGDYYGIITAARAQCTKEGTPEEKIQILLAIDLLDGDEAGKHLNGKIFVTGKDKNGKAMINQAYDALYACMTDDGKHVYDASFIHQLHAQGSNVAGIAASLVNKKICFSVDAKFVETGSGNNKAWKPMSEITNFIAPERYRSNGKAPHRVAYNLGQPPAAAPAGFENNAPGLPPGVPLSAGPTAGGMFGGAGSGPSVGGLATSGIGAPPAPSIGLGPAVGGLGPTPFVNGPVGGAQPVRGGDPLLAMRQ